MAADAAVKSMFRRMLRRVDVELVRRSGPHRYSGMDTALDWLRSQGIEVRTILDVGASDGRWSAMAVQYFPGATCILYEPNPVHVGGIATFKAAHPARVVHKAVAVGEVSGTGIFDATDDFGGALLAEAQSPSKRTIDVSIVSLDDSVRALDASSPFLLKLDTHGFERGILNGASRVLAQCEVLIIEAYNHRLTSEGLYFWELCGLLHERGFRPVDLVDIMHRERDGSLWQMDLVFLRDDWSGFRSSSYR